MIRTKPPVEYSERSVLRSIEALLRTNSEMAKTRVACGPVFDTPLLCAPKDLLAGALDIVSGRRLVSFFLFSYEYGQLRVMTACFVITGKYQRGRRNRARRGWL